MTPQDLRPDDRETLSALFDGELDAEARRFALRRLGHDVDWQRDCGRWQLAGDVLRRHAPIAAPDAFADRVAAAIATEQAAIPAAAIASQAVTRGGSRLRWAGGALAASLALVAAVSALRPGSDPGASAPAVVAGEPAAVRPTVAVTPVQPGSATTAAPAAAAMPVAAPAPRRLAQAPRATPTRSPALPARALSSRLAPASAPVEAGVAASFLAEGAGNPFNLGSDAPLTSRPWPRATVSTAGAAFTARYGTDDESAGERPSFYPFEPRLPAAPEPVPSP